MNFEEFPGKLLLQSAGIRIAGGSVTNSPDTAAELARAIGPCVIKAQVPAGKRGKAGGIKLAEDQPRRAATRGRSSA